MGRVDAVLLAGRDDVPELRYALAGRFGVGIDDVHVSTAVASDAGGAANVFVIPAEDAAQMSIDGSSARVGRPVVMPDFIDPFLNGTPFKMVVVGDDLPISSGDREMLEMAANVLDIHRGDPDALFWKALEVYRRYEWTSRLRQGSVTGRC